MSDAPAGDDPFDLNRFLEAQSGDYVAHPILGARLRECVETVALHKGSSAADIFGSLDGMKFRSCLTLFAEADGSSSVFARALDQFFGDQRDPRTLELLAR